MTKIVNSGSAMAPPMIDQGCAMAMQDCLLGTKSHCQSSSASFSEGSPKLAVSTNTAVIGNANGIMLHKSGCSAATIQNS